eukprot:PLAT8262.1.p1 GENE.PLAT8262.1~~PLAT8262.1.p1  ORF type:complete len:499 (-),score=183.93 PLAT8262.1:63-1559(-)
MSLEAAAALFSCARCEVAYSDSTADTTPRCLPCGHTICGGCLGKLYADTLRQCPVCHKDLPASASDVPVNHMVLALLSARGAEAGPEDDNDDGSSPAEEVVAAVELCGACELDSAAEATLFCASCDTPYCKSCSSDMHSRRAFARHEVVPLSSVDRSGVTGGGGGSKAEEDDGDVRPGARTCLEHRGEPMILYCTRCDVAICAYCEKYGEHATHRIISLSKVGSRKRERLAALQDALIVLDDFETAVTARFLRAVDHAESEWARYAEDLNGYAEMAVPLERELRDIRHEDASYLSDEGMPVLEQASSLCKSALATLKELYTHKELKPLLPAELISLRRALAKARLGGSSDVQWDTSKISSGYAMYYTVTDDDRVGERTATSSGTITILCAKEPVEAGACWTVRIDSMCAGTDFQIGYINAEQVTPSSTATCWLKVAGCGYVDQMNSLAAGQEVTIEFNGTAGASFTVDGSVIKTETSAYSKVYPCVAIRNSPGKVSLV